MSSRRSTSGKSSSWRSPRRSSSYRRSSPWWPRWSYWSSWWSNRPSWWSDWSPWWPWSSRSSKTGSWWPWSTGSRWSRSSRWPWWPWWPYRSPSTGFSTGFRSYFWWQPFNSSFWRPSWHSSCHFFTFFLCCSPTSVCFSVFCYNFTALV